MITYLEKLIPEENMVRFYNVWIEPNLFGECTLFRNWGRIGTRGQVKMQYFDSTENAKNNADLIIKTKKKRGYITKPIQMEMF